MSKEIEPSNELKIEQGIDRIQTLDWKTRLEKAKFDGNIDRGIFLMQTFAQAEITFIRAMQHRYMIPQGYSIPNIFLENPSPGEKFLAVCVTDALRNPINGKVVKSSQRIIVNPSLLAYFSIQPPEQTFEFFNSFSEKVAIAGRITDIMNDVGTEETAHSIFQWNEVKRIGMSRPNYKITGEASYDAQPAEYHGLGWRIRQTMDRNDLPENLKSMVLVHLQHRMTEAIEYRNAHREEYGLSPHVQ